MMRLFAGPTALLTSVSVALAQTPPVEGAPANTPDNTSGIGSYWWLIVLVVLAALAIWYFARNRSRT
jgi:hypothetical protein